MAIIGNIPYEFEFQFPKNLIQGYLKFTTSGLLFCFEQDLEWAGPGVLGSCNGVSIGSESRLGDIKNPTNLDVLST